MFSGKVGIEVSVFIMERFELIFNGWIIIFYNIIFVLNIELNVWFVSNYKRWKY